MVATITQVTNDRNGAHYVTLEDVSGAFPSDYAVEAFKFAMDRTGLLLDWWMGRYFVDTLVSRPMLSEELEAVSEAVSEAEQNAHCR